MEHRFMELATPRRAAVMPWLLLLCLATGGVLQALGQSTSTAGFISIDCGLPGEAGYTTNDKLSYATDAGFIDAYAGSNHKVAAEYIDTSSPTLWWNTVRSFPGDRGTRNCYTLRSLEAGLKYLIRAKFRYGNYDELNRKPMFDLYVGVNFWTTVRIPGANYYVYMEAIVVVPQDSVQVCLVNTGGGVPFISGLDLRPMKELYPMANAKQGLVLLYRINFGPASGSGAIGYPNDPYDRYWFPYPKSTPPAWDVMSTGPTVRIGGNNFQPSPPLVMQTAITTGNVSSNIDFTLPLPNPPISLWYTHTFYFSELQRLGSNARREFDIYWNVVGPTTAYIPKYLEATDLYSHQPFQATTYSVSLNATAASTLPPIINAMELFSVIPTTTMGTDSQDATAITAIKGTYQVQKNWMGDPCLPAQYLWDGLNCTYAGTDTPKISNVNLSSSGLSGAISPSFANLKTVQYLDLSNNNLTGSILDALSRLPSLLFLDLSNNKLNGSIPSGLLKKFQSGSLDLRYGNNPGLCSGNSCKLDEGKGKKKLAIYIGVPIVVIVTLVVVAMLCLWLQRRRKQGESLNWRSIKDSVEPNNDDDVKISLELENRQFTYKELEMITNNFQRQLGRGGFGYVFHGSLENGTEVAVKLRSHSSNQGVKEFLAEAQVLTRIHHKYLVSMIGFCTDREHMALVYEYMPQGTLQEHIAGKKGRGLPWRQRLRVALESAQGLEYLHKGCSPPIIHRDVKTTNMLLNAKLEVKIADFGLSKAYNCEDDTHLTTNIFAGTHGYADPEYMRTMQPSTKSDVYSFGVVLLELVTGKPAILRNPEPITLIDWARRRLAQGDIDGVVDDRMQGDHDINAVWKTTEIALKCTERSPLQRPSMTDIVMQLQECLDLEEGSMGGDSGFYTGSDIGGMDPNMGYNATSENSATLR